LRAWATASRWPAASRSWKSCLAIS
jgi:hypothetical protein